MFPRPSPLDAAFPATLRAVAERCAQATFDAPSFARPLRRCELARCAGTCCAHGATLSAEEALVVRQLTARHDERLRAMVPDLPNDPVVHEDGAWRTARKPRPMHALAEDYPPHFPDTACAYLDPDARCALQRLAAEHGRDPWAYKPLACWLHPIALSAEAITLPDASTDPHPGGFASATHCGRTEPAGAPAHDVLAPELVRLGRVLGRDLAAPMGKS